MMMMELRTMSAIEGESICVHHLVQQITPGALHVPHVEFLAVFVLLIYPFDIVQSEEGGTTADSVFPPTKTSRMVDVTPVLLGQR